MMTPEQLQAENRRLADDMDRLLRENARLRMELAATRQGPQPLTPRQRAVYDYLAGFIAAQGYAPTFAEIATHFGVSSLATVHEYLTNLSRKGWIIRERQSERGIRLVAALGAGT